MASQFTKLADVSRQPLKVGTPPAFIFTDGGTRYDRDLIALSVQLRIAEALERISAALEVKPAIVHSIKANILEPSPEELLEMERGENNG